MYLNIGGDMAVRERSLIGIFDLDNTTYSKHTRAFLNQAEREGRVIATADVLPKAFILTQEYGVDKIYLTQFGPATLEKRLAGDGQK